MYLKIILYKLFLHLPILALLLPDCHHSHHLVKICWVTVVLASCLSLRHSVTAQYSQATFYPAVLISAGLSVSPSQPTLQPIYRRTILQRYCNLPIPALPVQVLCGRLDVCGVELGGDPALWTVLLVCGVLICWSRHSCMTGDR